MPGPLAGLRVLDFSTLLPGPYGTMMLADMGAEVTRVVAPSREILRGIGNPLDSVLTRNKRSIFVDMKSPDSKEVIRRLIERSDILVEQFRPGVMARLGWGYPEAKAVNEKIIYCGLTGYGQNGPLRDRAGHDLNYLALSGILSYTGRKDEGPTPYGTQVADICAGSYNMVVGVLAAYIHREKTGEGQYVDIAMLDGSIALNAISGSAYFGMGHLPKREEEILNGGTLYDVYKTKDGKFISVGGLEPKFLAGFLKALGLSDLAQPGTSMHFMSNVAEAKPKVAAALAEKTLDEWNEIFPAYDCCVEPVLDLQEMSTHPQTQAREMIVDVDDNRGGTIRQIASPIKFSETPPEYHFAGQPNGAETDEILKELGFREEDAATLRSKGVFGT
jgi:crotonobetainyl-CoA:carnitine CoA-transferase CaiB-like acyl-CoA transferase